jgi:hypothetical protein
MFARYRGVNIFIANRLARDRHESRQNKLNPSNLDKITATTSCICIFALFCFRLKFFQFSRVENVKCRYTENR